LFHKGVATPIRKKKNLCEKGTRLIEETKPYIICTGNNMTRGYKNSKENGSYSSFGKKKQTKKLRLKIRVD